ncbi:MAG TPA: hypothetical protein VNU68_32025 [Verrucomicrobiae bacterium]|jgi:hypothetical protein|nr:hypothetical protein [Verrucomicrobiae bacterium]
MIRAVLLTLLLSGCSYGGGWWGRRDEITVRPPDLYTRPEVDAINAETQCRQLARTMLEAQRCGVRRY